MYSLQLCITNVCINWNTLLYSLKYEAIRKHSIASSMVYCRHSRKNIPINSNAIYEKEWPFVTAHGFMIHYETRIQFLTRQEGFPAAELPVHVHEAALLPAHFAVRKLATRNKYPVYIVTVTIVNKLTSHIKQLPSQIINKKREQVNKALK